jgi:hypothetical protein
MTSFLDVGHDNHKRAALSAYWLVNKPNPGISPYNKYSSFPVFRNVMDYGATGSGVTVYLLQVSRYFARKKKRKKFRTM